MDEGLINSPVSGSLLGFLVLIELCEVGLPEEEDLTAFRCKSSLMVVC